jgi:hypothetical protein
MAVVGSDIPMGGVLSRASASHGWTIHVPLSVTHFDATFFSWVRRPSASWIEKECVATFLLEATHWMQCKIVELDVESTRPYAFVRSGLVGSVSAL